MRRPFDLMRQLAGTLILSITQNNPAETSILCKILELCAALSEAISSGGISVSQDIK